MSFFANNARWLAAGALISFSSGFGQTYFISIHAGAIRSEFGLSHGEWGGIYTLGTLASAIVMLWSGGLVDRVRSRAATAMVLTGLAVICLWMAINPAAWMLIPIVFGLRFFGQGMTSHIAVVSAGRWFARNRGRAVSVISLGFSFGEAILPIIYVYATALVTWRGSWAIAAAQTMFMIPLIYFLLRTERTPQSAAEADQTLGMDGLHWTRKMALGHWLFWLILPAFMAPAIFSTSLFFQQVHLTETKGWPLAGFVSLIPIHTATAITAMLFAGWFIDRRGSWSAFAVFLIPMACGYVVFGTGVTMAHAALGFFLMGMTQGVNAALGGTFWPEYFGTRNLGSIRAMAMSAMVFGSAIGPGITGWLIDRGIVFEDQMVGFALYMLGACALAAFAVNRARHKLSPVPA